jgi:chromosome segregation ATPase
MVKEQTTESTNGITWVQDQLYQIKAAVGTLEQQYNHLQSMIAQLSEGMHKLESSMQVAMTTVQAAERLQEEVNHTVGIVVQMQDRHAETSERVELLERRETRDETHDAEQWRDVARKVDLLERQVAQWHDRQAGVDEVGRRFQEGLSLIQQQLVDIDRRLEGTETRSARALEGANRAEHTLTRVDASILAGQREDESLNERLRVTSEVAHRVENTVGQHLQDLQRLELLAERIELHRAERQRLEDRALQLEEQQRDLQQRSEAADQHRDRLVTQQSALGSRLDALQEQLLTEKATILEQLRKMTTSQERTKRRQVQELERELREMRQYIAALSDEQLGLVDEQRDNVAREDANPRHEDAIPPQYAAASEQPTDQ